MESTIAVLIDFENIAAGTEKDGLGRFDVELVLKRVKDKGRVLMARSYADWGRFSRFKQTLLTNNVTMMELTSHGMQDKNRADIALVVDALELAFTKEYIDTYVIVSGDSDFTPLVLKMRELDKRVIGCGVRSSTSRLLVHACDEFIFYDNIAKTRKSREKARQRKGPATSTNLDTAFHLLQDAVEGLQREIPDPPYASVVKNAMQRKSPDFTEAEFGFSTFGRFLEAAQKTGLVRLIREQKSGGYRVDGAGDGDASESNESAPAPQKSHSPSAACWMDPYLPNNSSDIILTLNTEGINPLAAPTRKAILDGMEESVSSRKARKRRINVQFVQEDVRRRMRKSHPEVPAKAIRAVFNALMRAGVLLHRDGSPVRTGSAPFTLEKDASELNEALGDIYLDALHHSEMDMPDITLLADLFHANPSQTRRIEETIAYLQANAQEDLDDNDLDSLLTVDPTTEVPKPNGAENPEGMAQATVAESEPQTEPDPKSEKTAKPKARATKKAAAEGEEAAEKPKPTKAKKAAPKTKSTSTAKKATKATKKATDKPKPKTTRKRKTPKSES